MPAKRIRLYLFRETLTLVLVVLAVMIVVILLVQFASVTRVTAEASTLGMGRILLIAVLHTPSEIEPVLPHVVLLGTALTVFRLRRRGELAVTLQTALSAPAVLVPVMAAGMALGVLHLAVFNQLAPTAKRLAGQLDASAATQDQEEYWHPQAVVVTTGTGHHYLIADRVDPASVRIEGVSYLATDSAHGLVVWIEAAEGYWAAEGWVLVAPRFLHGTPDAQPVGEGGSVILPVLPREALTTRLQSPSATTLMALPATIAFAESIGAPASRYRMQLANLLALPFLLGGVGFLAGAILLAPLPLRAVIIPAAGVLLAGIGIYMLSTVLSAMGAAGLLAPSLAAALSPLACLLAGGMILWVKRF